MLLSWDNVRRLGSLWGNELYFDATRKAQIYDFIQSLPDRFDTQIGEQGLLLSGGERQRLAIARAFLRDAPILVVDEPTAHLDAETERGIMQSIGELANDIQRLAPSNTG